MSKTIDERVVEMRFDNRQFESNVSTTMSTLDKLKQKLNFKGASSGLENISSAAKKVDMNGLANGVETVRAKFSALDVMRVTALANITNQAINAGKRIASALTIDPIKTGLAEYETKMNAIQVIKANTRGKNTMDEITAALDDLNDYADKTIYNFAQMTSNIGKFTAQGLDVNQAKEAVKGMANLAAASGASAEDMARATYQMSQALGGTIKMIDWNSLRNANMATTELKNTLIDVAKVHGIAIDEMIAKEGTFEQTLSKGWLSGEMFTEAMNIYSGVYSDAELKAKGFTDSQIANFKELAAMAESAATEVKTFTQLWDVLKETAQSGWTQTWELIFGDFETAKSMFTNLQEYFSNIINGWSDARNTLLGGALKPLETWNKIKEKLSDSGLGKIKEVAETVGNVTDKLEYFQKIVDKVWRGDYKNSDTGRFELLEKAGYDHRVVQDLVNKGHDYKLTIEDIEASHKKFGLTLDKTSGSTKKASAEFSSLSDEQLKNAGLTDAEIKLYRELEAEAKRTGTTIQELVDKMSKKDGRTLLIESVKNAWQGFITILKAVKDAWVDIFPPMTVIQLYNIIDGIHEFSKKLVVTKDTAEKLKRTFKGVFAALDIVSTVLGGGLKIAIKALIQLLGMFDLDILDVTANIGDAIVKFRDWIDSTLDFTKIFEKISPAIKRVVATVKEWYSALKNSQIVEDFIQICKAVPDAIKDWFNDIKSSEIAQGISNGLTNGLKDGAKKVWNAAVEFAKKIIDAAKNTLGIHSPSTVFFEIGKNIVEGLVNGIEFGISTVFKVVKWLVEAFTNLFSGGTELFKGFGGDIKEIASGIWGFVSKIVSKIGSFFGNIDFGTLIASGLSGGMLFMLVKIGKALDAFVSPLEGIGDILENAADVVKNFAGVLKSFSMSIKAKALKEIAIALAILVGSIALLCYLPEDRIEGAIKVITTLAIVIGALSLVMGKMGKVTGGIGDMVTGLANIAKVSGLILSVSVALLLMAAVVKIIAGVSWEDMGKAGIAIAAFAGIIAGLVYITKFSGPGIEHAGKMIRKIATAMLLLAIVAKIIATMSWDDMKKAGVGILGMANIIGALIMITAFAGKDIDKIGSTIFKIGAAMLALAVVAKIISGMTWDDMKKAGVGILALSAVIVGLIAATKLVSDKELKSLGSTLLGIGAAMFLMTLVGKMIAGMSWEEMGKAGIGILALAGIITGLIAATKLAGPSELKRVGSTLLMMSVAIGILAGVAMILGLMNIKSLAKGISAVAILSTTMALMVLATRDAKNCKGNLVVMTIAIATMAAAVVALSMIDTKKLITATGAIGLLMGIFALTTKFAGSANKSIGALVVITVAVGMIGFILYKLAELPVESTIGSAIALGGLLLALTVSIVLLSKFSGTAPQALKGVLSLTAMAIPLMAFVGILALMQNVQNAMENVKALSLLTAAMTLMLIPLTVIGKFAVSALSGVIALTSLAIPMIAFVGILAIMENLENAMENIKALTIMMGAMTILLIALALIGPMALVGIPAIAGVMGVILAIGALVIAIGALMEKFPQLQSFLDTGIPALEKLAHGIGSLVGNLVSGFADGLTDGLPEIGQRLTDFMDNARGFIDGAKTVDESVLTGVGVLAKSILALSNAELINGIASFLSGGVSFASMGTDLSNFITNAKPFLDGIKGVDPASIEAVKTLAETIRILTKADILESLTSWLTGGTSLADFGTELAAFGPSMKTYADSVAGIDGEAVKASTQAAKTLAEMANSIPGNGGWMDKIFGDNSPETFGAQLEAFGKSLKAYSVAVTGLAIEPITASVEAAKQLASMADAIPKLGGVVSWFMGETDLGTFGLQLASFGASLKLYGVTVIGLPVDAISSSVKAASALGEMSKSIPKLGGIVSWFTGETDLATFGFNLVSFGNSLKMYGLMVTGLAIEPIANSVKAARSIAQLAKALPTDGGFWSWLKDDAISMSEFGTQLAELGAGMLGYSTQVDGISLGAVNASVAAAHYLVSFINRLKDIDTSGVGKFKKALSSLGEASIDGFIKAFTVSTGKLTSVGANVVTTLANGIRSHIPLLNATSITLVDSMHRGILSRMGMFTSAGLMLMNGFVTGVMSQRARVSAMMVFSITSAVTVARGYYSSFYNAGSYLVSGFASGISANSYKAAAKARAMAKAAADAAEDELDINSPSKVFRKIGTSIPEGFAMGIDKLKGVVVHSAASMATASVDGVRDAISNIAALVNSDIDAQPTIRPVVDLSNVRAGAGAISSMFGTPIAATATVGVINSMMNRRNQNGVNDDVVSAIDKLRKELGSIGGGTTYSINGITYDDGSNVSDAIKTLVRAAKIERRV